MREHSHLGVAEFLRLLQYVLKDEIDKDDEFYFLYGLFKMFK